MAAKKRSKKRRRSRAAIRAEFNKVDKRICKLFDTKVRKQGMDDHEFWRQPSIKKMSKKRGDLVQRILLKE
jgi:hypothetical protein